MNASSRPWQAVLALVALVGLGAVAVLAAPAATRSAPAAGRPKPDAVKPVHAAPAESVSASPGDSAAVLDAAYAAFLDSTMGDSVRESRLYLSWGAPYGMPGARADVAFACRDTSAVDTLYLSFETGRDLPRFYAMIGYLNILPAAGDSLGTFWDYSSEGGNRGGIKMEGDPDGTFPCPQPFLRQGVSVPYCEFRPSKERVFFAYAVRLVDPGPVRADTRYCFARLLFTQKHCQLPGADQPVCIEWEKVEYSPGPKAQYITRGLERFVSVNARGAAVCAPHRSSGKPPAWLPRPIVPAPSPDSTRR
jgi:hypothetical protein